MSPSNGSPLPDSTAELQGRLDALKPGETLVLEQRVYAHSGVITVRVPGVRIDGNGATLQATNDETSALLVAADGVQVANLTLTAPTDGKRWEGLDQHKLVLRGNRATVDHVTIIGSAAAGVFVYGVDGFRIDSMSIRATRADGIHITAGSRNGQVANVSAEQTGDDAVAVVSYTADSALCHHIDISQVHVASTRWGRGITVVGGSNVAIRDFDVANTNAAGIYVASEGAPYFTESVADVTVSGGSVTRANVDTDIVQGAVLVYAGNAGKYVRNVAISDVDIVDTTPSAERNVAVVLGGGRVEGISFSRIHVSQSSLPLLTSDAPQSDYATSDWTLDGSPVDVAG
ncbi:MAG: right-handed parallel beta-helix repeat-containing protein [Mycobacterium sp.]